jgi:hypothetical protein
MEIKDYALIATTLIAIFSFFWGILENSKRRKFEKANKVFDNKYNAYKSFLSKIDELNVFGRKNNKVDFNNLLNIKYSDSVDVFQEKINTLHKDLLENLSNSLEPIKIMESEINVFYLDASEDVKFLLEKYRTFLIEFKTYLNKTHDAIIEIINGNPLIDFPKEPILEGGEDFLNKIKLQMRKEIQEYYSKKF